MNVIQPICLYHYYLYPSTYAVQLVQQNYPFATLPIRKKHSDTKQGKRVLRKSLQDLQKMLRGCYIELGHGEEKIRLPFSMDGRLLSGVLPYIYDTEKKINDLS